MKMKKLFVVFTILIIFIFLYGNLNYKDINNHNNSDKKFKVITTFTIIADMAKNVAGNYAIVESLTKPGAEIHNYSPTPGDIKKSQGVKLILWNGLNLENWFEKFFSNLKGVPNVIVTKGIKPISIEEGSYHGKPNPHAWMSPKNALIYIDNIKEAFMKYDPENAKHYEENALKYKNQIIKLIEPIKDELNSIPEENKWLVTSEGAFSYLAQDFKLKELYLWPINSDSQGSPKQIKKVIDTINKNKIIAIFSESTVSNKPAKQVAKETGIKYGGILYVDSLSDKKGKVPTYIDLLKVNIDTIMNALAQDN